MTELVKQADLLAMEQKLQSSIETLKETLPMHLTIRFGVMMVIWVAVGAIILKPGRHPAPW
jgi:hypothetical protein